MSPLVVFICWARSKAYLSGCMLALISQLLTTSSMYMICPQIHCLFGQPHWQRLEVSRGLQAAIIRGTASIKSSNVVRKLSSVILSVILTAPAKINKLYRCSSLCLRYMYFPSIYYWTCKLLIYRNLLPQFGTTYVTSCRGCKRKRPRRVLAINCCQNALRSFYLTATTRISQHGNSSQARTRCGCYKTSTTRSFGSWLFRFGHYAIWLFFSLIERNIYIYIVYI
jgi:hypothetical protein